ncbi:hypothetical protein BGX34_005869, partial [Mortierella sp. NVP85]
NSFVAAAVEGRGAGAEIRMCFGKLKTGEVILSGTTPVCTCIFETQGGPPARKNHNSPATLLGRLHTQELVRVIR